MSAGIVMTWLANQKTAELTVCGRTQEDGSNMFAWKGDSGSLLVREDPLQAVGLIHGVSLKPDLTMYTPLWAVLESVEQEFGLKLHVCVPWFHDTSP